MVAKGAGKSALPHGGAGERGCLTLSHDSTGERFAEKAPVERMFGFFTLQVVSRWLTPTRESAGARQHRAVTPGLSCFAAPSCINTLFLSHVFLLFPNPIALQCKGGWVLDISFYQNCSHFSLGISTENIPAGCSDSIWNVIRHQRHERDQHLAYLEGAEGGVGFLSLPWHHVAGWNEKLSGPGGGWGGVFLAFSSQNRRLSLQPWAAGGWGIPPRALHPPIRNRPLARVVQGRAAGRLSERGTSSAGRVSERGTSSARRWRWVGVGAFILNWGSWRCQRIAVLNLSTEGTYSPWKTQSFTGFPLDLTQSWHYCD